MMKKTFRQQNISHEGQIYIAENIVKFKDYFVDFLKKFDKNQAKVTTKDVEEFTRGLDNLREGDEPRD